MNDMVDKTKSSRVLSLFSISFSLMYYKQVLAVIDLDYLETKDRGSSLGYQNNSLYTECTHHSVCFDKFKCAISSNVCFL